MSSPNHTCDPNSTRHPYADYRVACDLLPFLALSDEHCDLFLRVCADAERWEKTIAALEFRVLEVGQLRDLLGRWLDLAERMAVPGAGTQLESLMEDTRRALGRGGLRQWGRRGTSHGQAGRVGSHG